MSDRRFSETDLREMLDRAASLVSEDLSSLFAAWQRHRIEQRDGTSAGRVKAAPRGDLQACGGSLVINEKHVSEDQLLEEARAFYASKGN